MSGNQPLCDALGPDRARRDAGLVLHIGNTISRSRRIRGSDMNLEKFTERARGFLQAAQTVALRMNHQRIAPAHLLKALLEDEQGMAATFSTTFLTMS